MGLFATAIALPGTLLFATTSDVAAGARAEIMAGSAPVIPSEPPRASFATELTPLAVYQLRDRRLRFVLRYQPRLFYRRPNVLGLDRPVLLHRASADERLTVSRSLTFRANLGASYGEVDYTGLSRILSPTQVSQLNLSILRLYDVEQTAALDARTGRRSSLSVAGFVGKGGPVDAVDSPIPTHARAGGGPTVRYRPSRTSDLRIPISVEYHLVNHEPIWAQMGELEWNYRASRRTRTTLAAGALSSEYPDAGRGSRVQLIAHAGITRGLVARRRFLLEARTSAGVRPTLNLLRAEYRPMAALEASLTARIPRWTAALRATLYTAATSKPLRTGEPETFFSAETPVIYAVNPNWSLEVGTRSLFRSPHWKDGLDVQQLQLWVYGAVTAIFGTERDPRRTVQ